MELLLLCLAVGAALAYDGHRVTEGPLKAQIAELPVVTELGVPQTVRLGLENTGEQPLKGSASISLVDDWRVNGPDRKDFEIAAGGTAELTFRIVADKAYSAHYPVHAHITFQAGGEERQAHPILVFETRFPDRAESAPEPGELQPVAAPLKGRLSLWRLKQRRAAWQYFDRPLVYKPVGWQGGDPQSRASLNVRTETRGGVSRQALTMHPPWTGGQGTLFAEYRLTLPQTGPIRLTFFNAIRDHSEDEPPSDGVTFRVWVDENQVFERHTDSKEWLEGEADLGRFGGQTVLLRLETHPGPKRDTTCDSSYWGEPTLVVGKPPATDSDVIRLRRQQQAEKLGRQCLRDGQSALIKGEDEARAWLLERDGERCAAVILPGEYGLADGLIAFVFEQSTLALAGLRASVLDVAIEEAGAGSSFARWAATEADGRVVYAHELVRDGEPVMLAFTVWAEKGALRAKAACDARITNLHTGPANAAAPRVYAGHGYVIENCGGWRFGSGGHSLSTSHVGFDFDNGVSLLQASDVPPDHLEVSPGDRQFALHTHLNATLTLLPTRQGAFEAAIRYRDICEKRPAGAVERGAGRFFFDIWGGSYGGVADDVERCAKYGLTDAVLIKHVWQRWGYDYRLPDIYPPDPRYGTLEDMQRLSRTCADHGILFGLHDNYIDIYPDADDFTYEHVYFTPDGRPHLAWLNRGRDARSYKWRPDHIQPFVERNLNLIKPDIQPTAYFIDVFTSQPVVDYWDWEGKFHDKLECQRRWGEAFAWIRDQLGNGFTCSEAGHDHLVGWLDGADCQHMTLDTKGRRFVIGVPMDDWERVPWFDSVLHDRFILYGVGYSGRYQGGRSRMTHGIYSDDYRTAEILQGHALMSDYPMFCRDAVKKYWHAHDLIRALALRKIAEVEFADDDIHRQIVTWDNGANVYVNRGQSDWEVEGHVLPQYGCWAKAGDIECAIETRDAVVVEHSRSADALYADARTVFSQKELPLRLSSASVERVGDRSFKLLCDWEVRGQLPKDLALYRHFDRMEGGESEIVFQGDMTPSPTSEWQPGVVTTGADSVIGVPADAEGSYMVRVGFWAPQEGRRYPAFGPKDGTSRCIVGDLQVTREGDEVTDLKFVPHEPSAEDLEEPRYNREGQAIDFGWVTTTGGLRLLKADGETRLISLPDSPTYQLTLHCDRVPEAMLPAKITSVEAIDEDGRVAGPVQFDQQGATVTFTVEAGTFGCRIK